MDTILESKPVESHLLVRLLAISEDVDYIKEELSEREIINTVKSIREEADGLFIKSMEVDKYGKFIEKSKHHISIFRAYLDKRKGNLI